MKAKIINKKVLLNKKTIYCGDKNVHSIAFEIPSEIDKINLIGVPAYIKTENELGQKCKTLLPVEEGNGVLYMEWALGAEATLVSGKLKCQIVFEHHTGEMVMNTEIFILDIKASVSENGPKAVPEYNHITQMQNELASLYQSAVVKKGDPISLLDNDVGYLTRDDIGNIGSAGEGSSSGISKVEKTSTSGLVDVYTIFLTNGEQYDFTVTNGKGIKQIYCNNSDPNTLIDSYTIVYTDDSTSSFTIKNGAKGDQGTPGIDGVGVENCSSGDSYEEDGHTVTPITIHLTNGEKHDLSVKAKNGSNIIDVASLSDLNGVIVNEGAIYRVPRVAFYNYYEGKYPSETFKCNTVANLPSVGNPVGCFDSDGNLTTIETYYLPTENQVYGYVDEFLSAANEGQIAVGWYPVENLFSSINLNYGGIIFSTEVVDKFTFYLLVEYDLYSYKNGLFKAVNVNDDLEHAWNNTHNFKKGAVFNNEVKFRPESQVEFNGSVDFSSAEISGLEAAKLLKTKVLFEELKSLMRAENHGMLVVIQAKTISGMLYNFLCEEPFRVGYDDTSISWPAISKRKIKLNKVTETSTEYAEYYMRIREYDVILKKTTYVFNGSTTSSIEADNTNYLNDTNFDFYIYK